jgi:hypothetical protein
LFRALDLSEHLSGDGPLMFPGARKRRLLAVVLVLVGVVLLAVLYLTPRPPGAPTWQPDWSFGLDEFAVKEPAPEIDGEDMNGRTLRLGDHRGQVVVVSFWVHW